MPPLRHVEGEDEGGDQRPREGEEHGESHQRGRLRSKLEPVWILSCLRRHDLALGRFARQGKLRTLSPPIVHWSAVLSLKRWRVSLAVYK